MVWSMQVYVYVCVCLHRGTSWHVIVTIEADGPLKRGDGVGGG